MEKYDVNQPVQLKKGVYKLNAERNFDYQLNRVINWDGGRIEDIRPVVGKIKTSSDWKRELIALGDKAMEEGRTQNAIAYYRMSEFFMYDGDPDTQDKLFKSLKEPPKEIREQFWERNKEKIQNGSILKELLGIKNLSANMKRDDFINCNGNPLKEMVFIELENNEKLTEEDITKDAIMNSFHTDADKKRFAKVYLKSVSNPTYLQDLFNQQAEESIHHMKNDTSDKEQAIAFFENS